MAKDDNLNTFKELYGDLGTIRITVKRAKKAPEKISDHTSLNIGRRLGAVPGKALKGQALDLSAE